jgi:Tol biopolymer transport system component
MMTMKQGLLAFALLCAPAWAQPAPQTPTAVTIDPQSFDRYAGYYQLGPKLAVRLWREEGHYFFGTVGTPQKQEIFPESPTSFFLKNAPVTLSFTPDGAATEMLVNQAGRDIHAPRIEQSAAEALAANAGPAPSGPRNWQMLNLDPKPLSAPENGGMDYWPSLSPDGKMLLFSRTMDGGKTWRLMRMPARGGAAEIFAPLPGSATRVNWSRNGKIVFNLDGADGSHAIWTANGDGGNAHALTLTGVTLPAYPEWYGDGKTILVGDAARNILYRVAEGSAPAPLTDQAQVLAGMASPSPDGKWIAFAGQKNNGQVYNQGDNQIWLADDKGVTHPLEVTPLQGRTPSWSPDGMRIAFESNRGSQNGLYAAFIVNRDGSGLVQVTDYIGADHPVFSPDGKRLIFTMGDPAKRISILAFVEIP